jgi:hypothetical protein
LAIHVAGEHLLAEVGVQSEGHVAQQVIAEGVEAVFVAHDQGLDHVAEALGYLAVVDVPVAVHVEMLDRWNADGVQHGGPEDGVGLEDVLGDEMLALRPQAFEVGAVGIADPRQVVDQRVEPDVADVLLVEGHRDAPLEA